MERERNYIKKEKSDVIFGIRTVIEAIQAEREINRILIQKGMNKDLFMELKNELADKNYQLQFVPVEKLNALTSGNHQGVIAFVSGGQGFCDGQLLKLEYTYTKNGTTYTGSFDGYKTN